jgi:hypothetical protein
MISLKNMPVFETVNFSDNFPATVIAGCPCNYKL